MRARRPRSREFCSSLDSGPKNCTVVFWRYPCSKKRDKSGKFADYSDFTDDIRKSNGRVFSWFGRIDRNKNCLFPLFSHSPGESLMFRIFTVIVIACSISVLVGCRFCSSPYDYCAPTFTGNNYAFYHGDPCHPNYTAGSRFLGTEHVCRYDCNSCGGGVSNCSSCETGYYESGNEVPQTTNLTNNVAKPTLKPATNSVKRIPDPPAAPAAPAIAVPQSIQGASTLKANAQNKAVTRELSTPRPTTPQANYAGQASDPAFGDPDEWLNELKQLNPDASEIKIIGFDEE